MCLANPSLDPQAACAELERLHDQVHVFYCRIMHTAPFGANTESLGSIGILQHDPGL